MKPAPFTRHVPRTLDEAVNALAEFAPRDGRVLAGGQSLVPIMAFRMASPAHLIDINEVEGLDRLAVDDGYLSIGACVRHGAFHRPVVEGPIGRLLAHVAGHIAHFPIRMRGTFCGSLAHADPSSEWCLVSATLGARLVLKSVRGERVVPIDEFLDGIMTTALQEDELLVEARLPLLADDTRFGFYEFSRRAGDFAMSAALVTYRLVDGRIADPRVGIGGAEARARRIPEAENVLSGQLPSTELFASAGEAAALAVDPIEDIQTTAEYRRDLVQAVTRRALDNSTR
ncbi:FAD binding domain-containing protein [Bradyrhizobium sp. SYSU BS000235]|uniref:FAD binding domain-containing protein n=1 Tax=Bradyrhizobium sp. SYSU BS000235 TaxID=3411332 RepID=UPI003C708FC0